MDEKLYATIRDRIDFIDNNPVPRGCEKVAKRLKAILEAGIDGDLRVINKINSIFAAAQTEKHARDLGFLTCKTAGDLSIAGKIALKKAKNDTDFQSFLNSAQCFAHNEPDGAITMANYVGSVINPVLDAFQGMQT